MEDVLTVYERPYDPAYPVVCLDETSRQLLANTRPPLPSAPGQVARQDPEYVRGGVTNLFLVTEPLRGWRHVTVSPQRTRIDFAQCVRELVDVHYPDIPMSSGSCWCWTNSTRTRRPRCTPPSQPTRRAG